MDVVCFEFRSLWNEVPWNDACDTWDSDILQVHALNRTPAGRTLLFRLALERMLLQTRFLQGLA
eukprot:3037792-Rhodomonas_salina.3